MAEGGGDLLSLSVQKLDEELTCPVCHEHFEEPKVLPCLHCYCKKCVAALIDRAAEGQPINCPECRRDVQVAENDPGSLPTAFLINRIEGVFRVMTKAEATKEMKCENCSELPSVAFCQQCGEYICDNCVKAHKRMRHQFSSHEVVSIASLRISIKKSGMDSVPIKAQELKCLKHKDEPLKLYCYMLVCRDCILIDHKDHKYAFIVDAAPQCKSTIEEKAESVQNVLPALKMALKSLAEAEEKLLAHHTATVKAIDNTHDRIQSKLQQKIKELKAAATQNVNTTQEKITAGRKNAELAVAEVTSIHEFLSRNLERATDQELFSLLKQMSDQAARAAQLYVDPPAKFPVPTLPQLEVHSHEDVLQVLQEDVYIVDNAIPNRVQKKSTVQKLTNQLEQIQQKMTESEAEWRKSIREKETAMAELTTEKEDHRKKLEEKEQELTNQSKQMQQKMAESEAAWRKSVKEKEAAMAELTTEKEDLRKKLKENEQEFTGQLKQMQQKMTQYEAVWRKSIREKEAAMAKVTTEKEYHRQKLKKKEQELTNQLKQMQQKMAESEAAWRKSIREKEAAMAELTTEKEYLRKKLKNEQEFTGQLKHLQQKMAQSEAVWRKSIREKEAATAKVTAEKEDLRQKLKEKEQELTNQSKQMQQKMAESEAAWRKSVKEKESPMAELTTEKGKHHLEHTYNTTSIKAQSTGYSSGARGATSMMYPFLLKKE